MYFRSNLHPQDPRAPSTPTPKIFSFLVSLLTLFPGHEAFLAYVTSIEAFLAPAAA
jgi:hypothetical protein